VLKADSDATVDIGIANISLAIRPRVGYLVEFTFHQFKMSKSGFATITLESKQTITLKSKQPTKFKKHPNNILIIDKLVR
jgi:hypothetical protein